MSDFTYDPSTDVGFARSRLGDTVASRAFFTDAEIQAAIDRAGDVLGALYSLCLHAAAEATRRASSRSETSSTKSVAFDDSRQPEYWMSMAKLYKPHAKSDMPLVESFFDAHVGELPAHNAFYTDRRRGD